MATALDRARQRQQSNALPPDLPEHPGEPWPDLAPIDEEETAPNFPLQVFPTVVQEYVHSVASDTHTEPDYAAGACLAAAAAAIGPTHRGVIKGGWSEQPSLWIGLVGEPSEKKTPNAKGPLSFLRKETFVRMRRYKNRVADLEGISPVDPDEPYMNDEGPLVINSGTVEGIAKVFEKQRRGLLLDRGELTGWLESFGQYKSGRGDDRQRYIEMSDGISSFGAQVERNLVVPSCCLSIFGGVQPEVMKKFVDVSDGLDARFLWIYPRRRHAVPEDFVCVNPTLQAAWDAILARLLAFSMIEEKHQDTGEKFYKANLLHKDDGGNHAWRLFTKWSADVHNDRETPKKLRDWHGKSEGFGMRLAVVMRLLAEAGGNRPHGSPITADDINAAATLMQYFHATTLRVLEVGSRDARNEDAKKVYFWLKRKQVAEFNPSLCHGDLRRSFPTVDHLRPAFDCLEQNNIIRRKDQQKRRGPKCEVYEVNPAIYGKERQ